MLTRFLASVALIAVFAMPSFAADDFVVAREKRLDPIGCKCVQGQILKHSVASEEQASEASSVQALFSEPQEVVGLEATRVTFKHRNNPAAPTYNSAPLNITTTSNFGSFVNYLEIIHTAALDPATSGLQVWAELQFQLQVAPTSIPANQYVGLAYAVWVQEDTNGDGIYGNVGDNQGYLDQTYNGPWLHTTNSTSNYSMANASHSFRMTARSAKLRIELYGIHTGTQAGTVNVNYGWAKVSSGVKFP